MKNALIPFVAAAMVAVPAQAEVEIAAEGPVVALSVTETVARDPDMATLSAGVTTVEPTAVEAMRANARQMNRVVDRIEELGIEREDIQTSGINLNADYEWDDRTRQQVFRGYRVTNRVSVEVHDIDLIGEVLDALVAVGANEIGGIAWGLEEPEPAVEEARQVAFASGHERALEYARMAGYSDVRLLEISENVIPGRPVPYANEIVVTASSVARDEIAPVRPGQVNAGITVNFSYEMIP